MKYLKKFDTLNEDSDGLIQIALGIGIPAATLTYLFINSVKKYKKENPDKTWKESFSAMWKETAQGAHASRKTIG